MLFGASTGALPLSLSPRKLKLVGIGTVQIPQTEFGPSTRQMGPIAAPPWSPARGVRSTVRR